MQAKFIFIFITLMTTWVTILCTSMGEHPIRLAVAIATYNEDESLRNLISVLSATEFYNASVNIMVINNNKKRLEERIAWNLPPNIVIHNNVFLSTHDFGHLARTWNQAILIAFDNLHHPKHDVLITLQADAELCPDWYTHILHMLKNGCQFAQIGRGDELVVHTIDSVRTIGLFDERFNGLTHQESDYFIRSRLYYPSHSCLHDYFHGYVYNPQEMSKMILNVSIPTGYFRLRNSKQNETRTGDRLSAQRNNRNTLNLLRSKWCFLGNVFPCNKEVEKKIENNLYRSPCRKMYPLYPWFERSVSNYSLYML
jgi:hypothetical protein